MSTDGKRIIVALDFAGEAETLAMLDRLDPALCRAKIGKELFTRCGPALVRRVIERGFEVFLDLKFHDIPNTVAGAVRAGADLGVWMLNVHAAGGPAMLRAAREAAGEGADRPLLIAVTVLTSLAAEDLRATGIAGDAREQVLRLARLTADCGLDGVVCSARETTELHRELPPGFVFVTPGIRPAGDAAGDQKRVETPASAIANGSTYLVIGRPITQAEDPGAKLAAIARELPNFSMQAGKSELD